MAKLTAYLQHGTGTSGPFRTEEVAVKTTDTTPINRSVSGYGNRLPTEYMVRVNGRWMRVYCVCYSNNGTLYVGPVKNKIVVRIDNY